MDNMEFLWNNLTDKTDSGLTRYDTKMLQGLSVLAMVVLHLFDSVDFQGLYTPLLYLAGKPVIFYFAQLSDFCVMGFAFCSGYGLYKKYMCVGGANKKIL